MGKCLRNKPLGLLSQGCQNFPFDLRWNHERSKNKTLQPSYLVAFFAQLQQAEDDPEAVDKDLDKAPGNKRIPFVLRASEKSQHKWRAVFFFYTKGFKRWLRVHIHTPFFGAWGYGIVMDCVLSANFKRHVGPVKLITGGLEHHIIY